MSGRSNGWHLNRTAPVAVIVVLVGWAVGAAWWTASLSAAVDQNKRSIESRSSHSLRLGILEERWRVIISTLKEIKSDVKALRGAR